VVTTNKPKTHKLIANRLEFFTSWSLGPTHLIGARGTYIGQSQIQLSNFDRGWRILGRWIPDERRTSPMYWK